MSTVYGYIVTANDDYFVRSVEAAIEKFSRAALPTSERSQASLWTGFTNPMIDFMVNFMPWLKHVPDWVPGTEWKRTMSEWRKLRDAMVDQPYNWAKTQIVRYDLLA